MPIRSTPPNPGEFLPKVVAARCFVSFRERAAVQVPRNHQILHSFTVSQALEQSLPQAHAGTLRQFVRYTDAAGLDLARCLDSELHKWIVALDQLETVPAHVVVDVLEVCAVVGEQPDLGIAFAAWSNLRGFGPLSLLWDHCPTFRDLVRVARSYLQLESQALGTAVSEAGNEVALVHFMAVPARYGSRQFIEATFALDVCLARMMHGQRWSPLRLELVHSPPRSERYRRRFFACPIEYGASRNALVLQREDMDRVQPGANAPMLAYLEAHLGTLTAQSQASLVERVSQTITAHLAGGHAGLDHVATLLAMSPRTLQRCLAAEGTSFGAVQQAVRCRIATDYLASETRPRLAELAYRLGFDDASAAGRFCRLHLEGIRKLRARKEPWLLA